MRKGIKPRTRWEIIYDILKETLKLEREGEAKKTRIMQGAYLDWRNFHKHLEFLMEEGCIYFQEEENCYHVTEKGRDLLKRLNELKDLIPGPSNTSKNLFRR